MDPAPLDDPRMAAVAQPLQRAPMRGERGTLGEPGALQQEGAGTHGQQRLAARSDPLQEVDGRRVVDLAPRADAAGHEQVVERRRGGKVSVRLDDEAVGAGDRCHRRRDHRAGRRTAKVERPGGDQLPGADEVQLLQTVERQETETHVLPSCRPAAQRLQPLIELRQRMDNQHGRAAIHRLQRGTSAGLGQEIGWQISPGSAPASAPARSPPRACARPDPATGRGRYGRR